MTRPVRRTVDRISTHAHCFRASLCRRLLSFGLATVLLSLTGCSLFVMAGKMITGDPKVTAPFRAATRVNLLDGKSTVAVLACAPHSVTSEFHHLDYTLVERITSRLHAAGIPVVSSNKIIGLMDDRGGVIRDPRELADDLEADYIAFVDVEQFASREDNSLSLYRGRVRGMLYVYEVRAGEGRSTAYEIFRGEFSTEHPADRPLTAEEVPSMDVFSRAVVDRASKQIAHQLYDHHVREEVL